MIATNEETLGTLFKDAITGLTPRLTYQGAKSWKPYDRAVSGPSRTRRFRLLFEAGNVFPSGAMAGPIIEHECILRVRTDYAGEHAKQQHILIDDFHQLGDTLTALKASDNGLTLVTRLRVEETEGEIDEDDVIQIDHVFAVRYMRTIQL
jgi:hypothetical protein